VDVFDDIESQVRSYCRVWPTVFDRAAGSWIYDEHGQPYLDFFAGAGSLNYGHNNPALKRTVLEYLQRDGVTHSLDMGTAAKRDFLETFAALILRPRGLNYRVQFPGPAGANAVEAALKLARKVTGRDLVITFTNAFHGMTLGALAVTGNAAKRGGAGVPLVHTAVMPYDNYFDGPQANLAYLDTMLNDSGSGLDKPAAVIVETVQGEGGVNVAGAGWLRELSDLCRRHDTLLIVDDVQTGCGRTGPFFSFEMAGIVPDIVCLAKSIGAYGLPMALTLIRSDLDIWAPGEHNGTFRGNNLAFIAGAAALRLYWSDDRLGDETAAKGELVRQGLSEMAASIGGGTTSRGRGLIHGLAFKQTDVAAKVAARAFDRGLLVETSGAEGNVVKLMPPLTASVAEVEHGLQLLRESVQALVA
jgi:diaminobutyrate-2-oxoglutarate transaminase